MMNDEHAGRVPYYLLQLQRQQEEKQKQAAAAAAARRPPRSSPAKPKRPPRPNHFLSLRIRNAAVWAGVADVQRALVAARADLRAALTPPRDLHLTLFVFHLAKGDAAALDRAREALAACAPLAARHFPAGAPPRVRVRGMGAFRKDVLFCRLLEEVAVDSEEDGEDGEDGAGGAGGGAVAGMARVRAFTHDVRRLFEDRGIVAPGPGGGNARAADADAWQAHATVAKTSKARSKKSWRAKGKGGRARKLEIPASAWAPFARRDFGPHLFARLELSAMMKKDASGYYVAEGSLPLCAEGADGADALAAERAAQEDGCEGGGLLPPAPVAKEQKGDDDAEAAPKPGSPGLAATFLEFSAARAKTDPSTGTPPKKPKSATKKNAKKVCRFGRKCKRKNCKLDHPDGRIIDERARSGSGSGSGSGKKRVALTQVKAAPGASKGAGSLAKAGGKKDLTPGRKTEGRMLQRLAGKAAEADRREAVRRAKALGISVGKKGNDQLLREIEAAEDA